MWMSTPWAASGARSTSNCHVDVDPQGCVWCQKCKQLLQTTGRNDVEWVKSHLSKCCAARSTSTLVTDVFCPRVKSDTKKQFQ
ncbi:hypothetical protein PR003_g18231 [Phytophthora rubi]|nr:hypothetical protein PR001_g17090 [Phytophthora rubi]KAE9033804.1 hypothetical protein PR002_g8478 [Phytophthora rubi]KAE9318427.1 hypothetical protein PR003_g18231 [Phytophthora rubi]